jgi:hypothetical protein
VTEPWASVEPWDIPGLSPGHRAHLARMEALERVERQRIEDERADRAEIRFQNWVMRRQQEMAFNGEPFDPSDWRTLAQSGEELAERYFAAQDRADERDLKRRMVEAGLLADLGPRYWDDAVSAAPAASRGASHPAPAAPDAGVSPALARVRAALRRWSRKQGTQCPESPEEYADRYTTGLPEITRSTTDGGRIIQ